MKKQCFERDNLRERERQSRAQMSLQGDDLQEAVPMFKPPVKITAADRVTQQIKSKLGDFNSFKQHLLDDPKTSIGVYGEPASPAPGGPPRGVEFKKPHHTSQNGRPQQRMHHGKIPDLNLSNRLQPLKIFNGKTPPNVTDPNGAPLIENILKEMKSLPTPLTAIASTPRKEIESFPFHDLPYQQKPVLGPLHKDPQPNVPNKNNLDRHSNPRLSADLERDLRLTDSEDEARKRMHPQVTAQSRGASSSGSDTTQSDSDSDSSSDDDSKPNGTRRSANSPPPKVEKSPEVVEGPGDASAVPTQHRPSWSLSNFAPQTTGAPTITRPSPRNVGRSSPSKNSKTSPRRSPSRSIKSSPRINNRSSPRINRASPRNILDNKVHNITSTAPGSNNSSSSNGSTNNAESDSCYDSTKEVESVLAEAKGKSEVLLLSSLSDSDAESESDAVAAPAARSVLPSSSSERSARVGSRLGARRSPRTPARPRPPSSPSASEDESLPRPPRPNPEKRKGRGRPPKLRTDEDAVKRRRGRPPKAKLNPPPVHAPPSSSDDERPPSSPSAPQHWNPSDSEPDFPSVATDKKKNDTLRKLFCSVGGAKGGGKGGGKGGKGKGQVMIIEAHTLEHKDDKEHLRNVKEEDAYRRLKDEDAQRKAKEEELALHKQKEAELQKKLKEEEFKRQKEKEELQQKRIKEERKREEELLVRKREEAHQKKLREEALQRRLKDEEAAQRRKILEEEMALKRKREDEALIKQLKEEEIKRRIDEELARKEEVMKRLREDDLLQRKYKTDEVLHRKMKEEINRRFKDDDCPARTPKEEPLPPLIKDEDVLQRRIREEEEAAQRQMFVADKHRLMVRIDLRRLTSDCASRLARSARALKRPSPPPATLPDKRPKMSRQNPETTPTNHERLESGESRNLNQNLVYYSYLERDSLDCSSDEESRDHKYYLAEATRLRTLADRETDALRRVMLYQESVLCFVLTGRVLELELDTKKAFTMYRGTYEYIKSIHCMPNRCKASPFSTLTKLDILSFRCQALLCLRMFKMYKREVKESNKILQEYQQKQSCPEAIGTVSPLSPTPSPAGSVGSVGSAGSTSSGYGSCVPAATPQHTPGSTPAAQMSTVAVPASVHSAQGFLVKYYTFLHMGHDLWDQADALIKESHCTDLFISVDRVCGPLTLHSTFRHLVKYVRYAISLLKHQARHNT